ncbi:gamma-glutamylcyclotransferase [Aliiroseovarius sp. KMU-50]|uniref:Gamma-glutamylcyclotransferase n=1 Tax=Aliiroseovarius salicola TaxID=3009082 RepID=A0ABT4VYZ7_9RHOB|nr:gamma-glutamylcyclotransferase family protein [Aliiroseovarius sp. KMU-50]MDA5093477.1 gamma-glutamylcyclotransferase [Aliiroseovarius sp. KMU-50]
MKDPFFFGYGSLVNRRTHAYENAQPARLSGWRRAWRASPLRAVCYLTAVPCDESEIDGLIASVPGADWEALDHRERAYARVPLNGNVSHQAGEVDLAVYAIKPGAHADPTRQNPVLMSYLDVVVQGYLDVFGRSGVDHFFETTDGWHAPIKNDRAAPIYPRAQATSDEEKDLVDGWLKDLSAEIE